LTEVHVVCLRRSTVVDNVLDGSPRGSSTSFHGFRACTCNFQCNKYPHIEIKAAKKAPFYISGVSITKICLLNCM
jgi:hypothetical protein